MGRWYVVQTRQGDEERADVNLKRQGFGTYLPRYLRVRAHARRRDVVRRPLFPNYLFVQLDLERDPWRAVNSTFGVRTMVGAAERPLAVLPEVIEEIRGREDERGYVVLSAGQAFRQGDRIRIVEGPLYKMEGLFQADDAQRAIVLLDLLGRKARVKVPRRAIVAAG